jgi:hypothetical protein
MITIGVLLLLIAAVLLGIIAKQSNAEKAFALLSGIPLVLLLGSLLGLARNGNSMAFFEAFALSLVFSVLAVGFGTALIIQRVKNGTPTRTQVLLTLLASCPTMYALSRWILSRS